MSKRRECWVDNVAGYARACDVELHWAVSMRPNSNSKGWADNLQAYRSAHLSMKRGDVAECWMGWSHSVSSSLVDRRGR